MPWFRVSWLRKLVATLRPQSLDDSLDAEFRFHLEQRIEEFVAQGMTPDEARREAAILFGNRTQLHESAREPDILVWLQTVLQDLRYTLRTLRRSPGFAMAAVLSLALGIGANTAIFTLLDQVILRTLPAASPEQLVQLTIDGPVYGSDIGANSISYPLYRDVRDRNQAFTGVLGYFQTPISVAFGEHTERVEGELVTGSYFDVLGVRPALGRVFHSLDDAIPNGDPLAVLSYDYWVDRFQADPTVVGRTLVVDGLPLTIVGVSQKGFDGVSLGHSPKIRIPISMKARLTQGYFSEFFTLENRRAYWVTVIGRLKPGLTRQQAQASLQPLFHSVLESEVRGEGFERVSREDKARFLRSSLLVLPAARGNSLLRRQYDAPLRILMAIVGLVLLIACANVANLLLARAAARQREVAVRLAIGASAGRVTRHALLESLLLAFTGGGVGLLLAIGMDRALLRFLPTDYGPASLATTPDARVLGFTFAVCCITGLFFGLVPVFATRKVDLAPSLKVDAPATSGGRGRVRQALVIAQVSLSALLLIAATEFLRSLSNLHNLDTGMQTRNVLEFSVNPSLNGYDKPHSVSFYRALLEKLRAAPGVDSAAGTAIALLNEDWWTPPITIDYSGPQSAEQNPNANLVSRGFFAALAIPLESGRGFTSADVSSKHRVVIINQAFARKYFAGRNPVGHYIGLGNDPGTKTDLEVIGVAKDSRFYNLRGEIRPQIYFDNDQNPDIQQINVYLRTGMTLAQASPVIRQAVRSLDPAVPVFALRTLDEQADLTLARDNMLASLTAVFGVLATILAAIGIYGVMSFSVARRTREIAVRMALGARRQTVEWLVIREVLTMAAIAFAVSVPAARALMSLAESQLYGVKGGDFVSIAFAIGALASVALLAAYLLVRRAALIDPMQALRSE